MEGAERERIEVGRVGWRHSRREEGGKLARCFTLMPNLELG